MPIGVLPMGRDVKFGNSPVGVVISTGRTATLGKEVVKRIPDIADGVHLVMITRFVKRKNGT